MNAFKHKAVLLYLPVLIVIILLTGDTLSAQTEELLVHLPYVSKPYQAGVPSISIYLPIVAKPVPPPPVGSAYDMTDFMTVDGAYGTIYEVQHSSGSQARHQTQTNALKFFHTKGEPIAEWEELWATSDYIYRGTDTSPGDVNGDGRADYYTLRENNQYGSKWAPRFWRVGDIFERNPLVTFYSKDTCGDFVSGTSRTWLKFETFHEKYTFASGITVSNVVQLAWLLAPNASPIERYYYAEGYGLVGWESTDGHGFSYLSEIHSLGQRPNNVRETISCLNQSGLDLDSSSSDWPPLPPEYARYVK
jgi:hypothetical protein